MKLYSQRFKNNDRLQTAANNNPPLQWNDRGLAVEIYQKALIDLRYPMPRSTRKQGGKPDGIYGEETVKVTKKFQKDYKLEDDGRAGEKTLTTLDALAMLLPVPKFDTQGTLNHDKKKRNSLSKQHDKVTVYIWDETRENIGHASCQIGNGRLPSGRYISWWPGGYTNKKDFVTSTSVVEHTLEFDIDAEGLPPQRRVNIFSLDIGAMIRWWDWFRIHRRNWGLLDQNCTKVVTLSLKNGGADEIISGDKDTLKKYNLLNSYERFQLLKRSFHVVWSPMDTYRYAIAIQSIPFNADLLNIDQRENINTA